MNKFKFYFILSFITLALFSCNKNDDNAPTPPRDRAEQYTADLEAIETYLKTHYMDVVTVEGLQDVEIKKLPAEGKVSIWDNTEYPLQFKMIKHDGRTSLLTDGVSEDLVEYKLYYILLNEGGGDRPSTVDSVYTSYRGWKLDNEQFDENTTGFWSSYPALSQAERTIVSGYRQFLPLLKASETATIGPDGTISYTNTGAGVVFIPSGLGYFNQSSPGLPSYTPLVFTVRTHSVFYRDHDRDGIKTYNEDLNGDGNFFNDDTDSDKVPNFLDFDDDGDNVTTKQEIKNAAGVRYEYDMIPNCQFTTGGLKRYLDPSCHKDPE